MDEKPGNRREKGWERLENGFHTVFMVLMVLLLIGIVLLFFVSIIKRIFPW